MFTRVLYCLIFGLLYAACGADELTVSPAFGSGMVLQQRSYAPIHGQGTPSSVVRLTSSWGAKVATRVNSSGRWVARLRTSGAGGPHWVKATQDETSVTLSNVMLGEVWLALGQSNMDMSLSWSNPTVLGGADEIAASANNNIRFLRYSPSGPTTSSGTWAVASPSTTRYFSAVGYWYAKRLQASLNVPIGIVQTTGFGTAIERWMSAASLEGLPGVSQEQSLFSNSTVAYSDHFESVIKPLLPMNIRGAIIYQGESNTWNSNRYTERFTAFVNSYRREFQRANMPFYFVQTAPYSGHNGRSGALRSAQAQALSVPLTAMAVTLDLVDDVDIIHPSNKKPVADRLANLALKQTYRKPLSTGPFVVGFELSGGAVDIRIGGATTLNLTRAEAEFEVIDPLGVAHPATSVTISGTTVTVAAETVPVPVGVRYAFSDTAAANLFNEAGLPVGTFKTVAATPARP